MGSADTDRHERHAFSSRKDRIVRRIMSSLNHPMARRLAAIGLQCRGKLRCLRLRRNSRRWRCRDQAQTSSCPHEVMEFENRLPGRGLLHQCRTAISSRRWIRSGVSRKARTGARPHLKHNCPISFVTAKGGGTIRFVEYVRFLDFDIRTCLARNRAIWPRVGCLGSSAGWRSRRLHLLTVSTMDSFDVLPIRPRQFDRSAKRH